MDISEIISKGINMDDSAVFTKMEESAKRAVWTREQTFVV